MSLHHYRNSSNQSISSTMSSFISSLFTSALKKNSPGDMFVTNTNLKKRVIDLESAILDLVNKIGSNDKKGLSKVVDMWKRCDKGEVDESEFWKMLTEKTNVKDESEEESGNESEEEEYDFEMDSESSSDEEFELDSEDEDEDQEYDDESDEDYEEEPVKTPFYVRASPPNLGMLKIPKGSDQCLKGFSFCVTGVMNTIDRPEVIDLIKRHGGVIKTGISRNCTHVLMGVMDVGPKKLQDMKKFPHLATWGENDLFNWIRNHPLSQE